MRVILLERVEKLGQMGDEVTVKDGFARNFLLPRRKALRATQANKAYFETQRADIEATNLAQRQEAEKVAEKIAGVSPVLLRQAGEAGQLYGSVTSRDIVTALDDDGFKVERAQVVLDRAIKTLGIHDIVVRLHPEVSEIIKVNVARSREEAEMQARTGTAVVSGAEEEEDDAVEAEELFEEGAGLLAEEPEEQAAEAATEEAAETGDEADVAAETDTDGDDESKA